jgi:AraC-like DNA-binding protein
MLFQENRASNRGAPRTQYPAHRRASIAELGVARFPHAFKADNGPAPYRYILQRRIQRSKRLLRTTHAAIASVAARLGCSSDVPHLRACRGDARRKVREEHERVPTAAKAHLSGALGLGPICCAAARHGDVISRVGLSRALAEIPATGFASYAVDAPTEARGRRRDGAFGLRGCALA